jgi:hypothetical protein
MDPMGYEEIHQHFGISLVFIHGGMGIFFLQTAHLLPQTLCTA